MKERSFDEMIAYFNRRVSEMDIAQDYKMELLGMVTALGFKHEKSAQPERKRGRWIIDYLCSTSGGTYQVLRCSICKHLEQPWQLGLNFCPNCGTRMKGEDNETD